MNFSDDPKEVLRVTWPMTLAMEGKCEIFETLTAFSGFTDHIKLSYVNDNRTVFPALPATPRVRRCYTGRDAQTLKLREGAYRRGIRQLGEGCLWNAQAAILCGKLILGGL